MEDEEAAFNEVSLGNALAGPSTASTGGLMPVVNDASNANGESVELKLSKNAQKRAIKQARLEALKPIKRQAERQKRRERKAQLTEGYAAGTLSPEDQKIYEERKSKEKFLREVKKKQVDGKNDWKGGVIVDLAFDDLMTEQEIASMNSQLGFLYSVNRTAPKPICTVIHTSFSEKSSPRLHSKMMKSNIGPWTRSQWFEKDLDTVARDFGCTPLEETPITQQEEEVGPVGESAGNDDDLNGAGPSDYNKISPKTHTLVYLSADSEEELQTLKEDEVYIIGGIVDRNRHKNLCQNKAERLGIRTARLPIGTFLSELPTRKVLTVNQVFEILVEYVHRQDWRAAFEVVIPPRKYLAVAKRKRGKSSKGNIEDGGDVQSGAQQQAQDDEDSSDDDEEVGEAGEREEQDDNRMDEEEDAMNASTVS